MPPDSRAIRIRELAAPPDWDRLKADARGTSPVLLFKYSPT